MYECQVCAHRLTILKCDPRKEGVISVDSGKLNVVGIVLVRKV